MARLPEGTVSFMLTDLQGSTRAWESAPRTMRGVMVRHDEIVGACVRAFAGELVEAGREGDSVLAVFTTAANAAECALDVQRRFAAESWPDGLNVTVRIALHTGEAQLREGHYFGPALNRCARLLATCHPGQILVTKATESMLADELPLGTELRDLGMHRLKDLSRLEQVFQLDDVARPAHFPPIESMQPRPLRMPRHLTDFVGRRAELAALESVLTSSRMVTVTGAGGCGKTRLAAELVKTHADLWPGGVWWVELGPVNDPRQVPGVVVAALELSGRGPAIEVVAAWLVGKRALLVLDDCEHLLAACADFCGVLLERCPELTVVATSRAVLGVAGEARWPVSSMSVSESAELFESRGGLVVPGFKVSASNAEAVTSICERLDGLPLAIELAAARVGLMTEPEILSQLSDRFRLLTGGSRTAPERQQTMMATIDWSYRLLNSEQAVLYRRLAVFRGGFTLDSAEIVCGAGIPGGVLDSLAGLAEKSMVVAERTESSGTRYRLLESQIAHAEDRLRETGELDLVRHRHYEHFHDRMMALSVWPASNGPERAADAGLLAREWKARESANLLAALAWARTHADDLGLSLALEYSFADLSEARILLADLLAHSSAQGSLRIRALARLAFLAWVQGDSAAALLSAQDAVALAREHGDAEILAGALNQLGMAHQGGGELIHAEEMFAEASRLLEGSTNRTLVAAIKNSVGMNAVHTGDFAGAVRTLTECVALDRAVGDLLEVAYTVDSLAMAQLGVGDLQAAAAGWKEALSIGRRYNDDFVTVGCLEGLSSVAGAEGDDHRCLRLAAAAQRMSEARSLRFDVWGARYSAQSQERSRSRLGTGVSNESWQDGWAMTIDEATVDAMAVGGPG